MNEKLVRGVRRLNSSMKADGAFLVALPMCWRGIEWCSLSCKSPMRFLHHRSPRLSAFLMQGVNLSAWFDLCSLWMAGT